MKQYFISGFAAVALCAGLASCSNHDFETWTEAEIAQMNYETAFIKRFGQPASNQTWGFGNSNGKVKTRTASPNANMWGSDWEVPNPLTYDQKDKVRRFFQQNKNPQGIAIDYTDFFVQDVYKGGTNLDGAPTTETYTAANGDVFKGSEKMNKLTAGSDNDHISNYNNAQCSTNNEVWDGTLTNPNDQNSKVFHSDQIMLMTNSKTDCFGFSNSLQSGIQYNKNYVIISGDEIMKWDNSGADVSGMYFVGFDYDANFDNGFEDKYQANSYLVKEVSEGTSNAFQIPNNNDHKWYVAGAADGYYSDWVVRIVPGVLRGATPEKIEGDCRVIAEDLTVAENGDFDFNDVVFDVKYGNPATIILQAAGGTLPLYIEGNEVHEMFGVSTNTMVNTGAGATKDPVVFSINKTCENEEAVANIKVEVEKNGERIELVAPVGRVASKICVGVDYDWCTERVDIEKKYPKFGEWVTSTESSPSKAQFYK